MLIALLSTLAIIIVGFTSGIFLRRQFPQKNVYLSIWCTRFALQGAIPISLLLAIWQLQHLSVELFLLTIIGSSVILIGGPTAALLAKILNLSRSQTGAYIPIGFFMNIGAIGSFCVYLFFGENGLALVPLYKLFEEVIYYAIAFPIAKHFGHQSKSIRQPFWQDPFLLTTLSAVSIGFILNLSGILRPHWMSSISAFFVPLGTCLLMMSAGLVFRLTDINGLIKPAISLAVSRTIISPLLVIVLASALGLWSVYGGIAVKVAFLLAFMPTAFLSLVPPVIYGVDQKIANSCWLVSSLWFLITLPLALFAMKLL